MKILSLLIATAYTSEEADCPSVADTANKAMIWIIFVLFNVYDIKSIVDHEVTNVFLISKFIFLQNFLVFLIICEGWFWNPIEKICEPEDVTVTCSSKTMTVKFNKDHLYLNLDSSHVDQETSG